MRRLLAVGFWLLAVSAVAFGADVKLAWDANDPAEQVSKYTVYEKVGSNYTKVADVTTTTYTITNVQHGRHVYVVTASNVWQESGYSNEAVTPNVPQPPKSLVYQIVVTP